MSDNSSPSVPTTQGERETSRFAWVSCSIREFGPVGDQRHLVRVYPSGAKSLVTVCGHSASVQGIWRADMRKPKCKECASHDR